MKTTKTKYTVTAVITSDVPAKLLFIVMRGSMKIKVIDFDFVLDRTYHESHMEKLMPLKEYCTKVITSLYEDHVAKTGNAYVPDMTRYNSTLEVMI